VALMPRGRLTPCSTMFVYKSLTTLVRGFKKF